MAEHRSIVDAERHEPKGASTAFLGQVLTSVGGGATQFDSPSNLINIGIGSVLNASSNTSQNPSGTDTAYQVLFGSGASNEDVEVSNAGLITFGMSGLYVLTFDLNFGRMGGSGTSHLVARLMANLGGGESQFGFVKHVSLNPTDLTIPFTTTIITPVQSGSTFRVQLVRDGAGDNSGGLLSFNPTISGWNDSPSAGVRIQRIKGGGLV